MGFWPEGMQESLAGMKKRRQKSYLSSILLWLWHCSMVFRDEGDQARLRVIPNHQLGRSR